MMVGMLNMVNIQDLLGHRYYARIHQIYKIFAMYPPCRFLMYEGLATHQITYDQGMSLSIF